MAKNKHYYIRKTHRWLGIILGIQFVFWTIGGLYFSWSNIDEVHGDFQKRNASLLSSDILLVSPTMVLAGIKKVHQIDSVVALQLIEILGKPFYQVRCIRADYKQANRLHNMQTITHLADAATGQLRGPLTKEEAIAVASRRFMGDPIVKSVEYLSSTGTIMNTGKVPYRLMPLHLSIQLRLRCMWRVNWEQYRNSETPNGGYLIFSG
jgi:hypothetical protein